jgi:hypothetical protein
MDGLDLHLQLRLQQPSVHPAVAEVVMSLRIASLGLLLTVGACTTVVTPPERPPRPPVTGEGAGYEHSIAKSRFDVGAGRHREIEGPYERVVGDRGAFMLDTITGATLAVPGRAAPIPKGAAALVFPRAMTENPDEHTAAVRAYLVGAGIPEAQVGGTHVTTTMAGGGPVKEGVQSARSRLLWYTSHLERAVGGVPVEGSFAFAAFDSNRTVISEGVYWPGIPEGIVRRAREFKQRLDSENERGAFLARVRSTEPDLREERGEVRVVHTSAGHHGGFEARPLYTVVRPSPNGGKARVLRFDESGALVIMPDERPTGSDSEKRQ